MAAALLLAACEGSPVASSPVEDPSFEAVLETVGEGASAAAYLDRAPEGIRLTDEQRAALRALNASFVEANRADVAALRTIIREAITARRDGADASTVRAILERSRPIRERLVPAFQEFRRAVRAILTDAQRAWLASNNRRFGPQLPLLPSRP